jgi:hypothetical protein
MWVIHLFLERHVFLIIRSLKHAAVVFYGLFVINEAWLLRSYVIHRITRVDSLLLLALQARMIEIFGDDIVKTG